MLNCARLYNAALEEWKTAYKHSCISPTLYDQMKELTGVRHADSEFWGAISIQVVVGYLCCQRRLNSVHFRQIGYDQCSYISPSVYIS